MWMASFRYITASTKTVQDIIKENNLVMTEKIKERTKNFQINEIKNDNNIQKSMKEVLTKVI